MEAVYVRVCEDVGRLRLSMLVWAYVFRCRGAGCMCKVSVVCRCVYMCKSTVLGCTGAHMCDTTSLSQLSLLRC